MPKRISGEHQKKKILDEFLKATFLEGIELYGRMSERIPERNGEPLEGIRIS